MPPIELLESARALNLAAYLDPGAGSMVFQVVLASLLSGMFFLRSGLSAIKGRLSGTGSPSPTKSVQHP